MHAVVEEALRLGKLRGKEFNYRKVILVIEGDQITRLNEEMHACI